MEGGREREREREREKRGQAEWGGLPSCFISLSIFPFLTQCFIYKRRFLKIRKAAICMQRVSDLATHTHTHTHTHTQTHTHTHTHTCTNCTCTLTKYL